MKAEILANWFEAYDLKTPNSGVSRYVIDDLRAYANDVRKLTTRALIFDTISSIFAYAFFLLSGIYLLQGKPVQALMFGVYATYMKAK